MGERKLAASPGRRVYSTDSAEATIELGRELAGRLRPGAVVAFFGDLGSGKTTMIKGIALGLSVSEVVRSPSFVIAADYDGRVQGRPARIHHIDLYRIQDVTELSDLGFGDYVSDDGVTLIEWAERASLELPVSAIRIALETTGEHSRRLTIEE
jgi:tRNA threonylcarbamoyladenosine biosynthesis protein TsaE